MHMNESTFTIKTTMGGDGKKANKADAQKTVITLTACDVPDDVIATALTSGQSPRVRWQNYFRENGVPVDKTMPWSEWIGDPPKVTTINKLETPDEIAARARIDPNFRKQMLEKMGFSQD